MITVGSYDAKTHLAELLDKVEAGEQVTITRHRRAVARMVPVNPARQQPVSDAIKTMRAFRQGHKLGKASLREMIEDGRR